MRPLHSILFRPARLVRLLGLATPLLLLAALPLFAEDKAAHGQAEQPTRATAEDAKHFFNGKDLTGWYGAEGLWSVDNGELVGKTTTGLKHNEFLKSKLSFGDFRLVVKIKLVPNEGNSGIQFHSKPHGAYEMSGPQADAGKGWWGKLYGENFGDKVIGENKSGEEVVKPNEWNTYEVLAVGTKVRTAINGHLCVDEDIPNIPREGIFGLQVHAGGPTEVRFKDFQFELDPKFELKTVR